MPWLSPDSHALRTLVLGALISLSALTPIADGDIFWHLAAGRQMWSTFALLRADPFSVDAAGREWIDVHWLFQLGVYAVHAVGGLRGLLIVKAALTALGAWLLLRVAETGGTHAAASAEVAGNADELHKRISAAGWFCVLVLASAIFAQRHSLSVRPVIVTLVLSALFLLRLERFRTGSHARTLLWLPLLQVLWANCQGLFGLGPALVASYLVGAVWQVRSGGVEAVGSGRRAKSLGLVLGLCCLASLITPWGVRGPWLAIQLLLRFDPSTSNVYSSQIAENLAPWAVERTLPGAFMHLRVFLLLLALSFVAARKRLVPSHAMFVLALVVLALAANRNVLLLYWLASPIVALNLGPTLYALAARLRAWVPSWRRAVAAPLWTALLGVGVLESAALAQEPALDEPTPFRFPTGAVEWLAGAPGGSVFCADHQGGYVIWSLYPHLRPFMDTRLVLRTREEYEDYLDLLAHPVRFAALQRARGFAYALLPTAYPERYLGLIQQLAENPDWKLVYTDGSETLFAFHSAAEAVDLNDRATTDALLARCSARYGGGAPGLLGACRVNLASLALTLGFTGEARHALAGLRDPIAQALLARSYLAEGELAASEAIARRMIASDGEDREALELLAGVELARGRPASALPFVRRALAVNPFDATALELLRRVERAAPP